MREIIPEFHAKILRFGGGERFPVVLDRRGVPLCEPVYYLANERDLAVNTLESKARTFAMVHNFLGAYGVEFRTRLPDGRVLDYSEASALRHHLRTIGRRSETIQARRNAEEPGFRIAEKNIVQVHEWHRRRIRAAGYLSWLVDRVRHELKLTAEQSRRIDKEIDKAKLVIAGGGSPHATQDQVALLPEQWPVLLDAIRPGSDTNPFPEVQQFRNFALIITYWENGLRRSEVLGLKYDDLSAAGKPPTLKLVHRPDDPDETRARPPALKTMPREVPITPILHGVLTDYIRLHRRQLEVSLQKKGDKQALRRLRSNPYIFVGSQGRPLSLSSVQKIFDALRMRTVGLPLNLSPHALRRTWNDMFTEMRTDTLGPRQTRLREFLMGWVSGSSQSASYSRRSTEREAARAISEMQTAWMARWEALKK